MFCLISQKQWNVIPNIFFSLKLRSVRKFWIQNHFWPIPGGWDICETKWGSSTQKFIIILTRNGPDSLKMTTCFPDKPWLTLKALKCPWEAFYCPNCTNSFKFLFILNHISKYLRIKMRKQKFFTITFLKNLDIQAPLNHIDMVMYSKFVPGSQFSEEKKGL